MKVLIVKTSAMGDIIHTYPAVTDARRLRPDVIFDWCVEALFFDLPRLHPGVRATRAATVHNWLKRPFAPKTLTGVRNLRQALRDQRYDLVIDAQGLIRSAVLSRLAGAPVAGYDRASAREGVASLLYDRRFAVERDLHAIARTRLLFGAALGYRPDLSTTDSGLVPAALNHSPVPGLPDSDLVAAVADLLAVEPDLRPRAMLLHGTSRPSKEWPLENWIATAKGLVARGLAPVVTWGNERERQTAEAIVASVPETILIPKSALARVAIEIERASLVIGVDTGLLHLADAYRRPTIGLFLGSSAGLTGPVSALSTVLPPDAARSMDRPRRRDAESAATVSISPDEVLAAADQLLGGSSRLVGD